MATSRNRMARFVIVGAGANLALLGLSYVFQRLGMAAFLAGTIAYGIAFAAAYRAQHGWTFGGARTHASAFPRYLLTQFLCALAAGIALALCRQIPEAGPLAASVAATLTAGTLSYLLSSRWVFAAEPDSRV